MKMIYIEPCMKVVEMAMDVNIMAESDVFDYADVKEKNGLDDELWVEESSTSKSSNLWDKEW